MALGSMQVPHYPAKDFAEHHHFLQILANISGISTRSSDPARFTFRRASSRQSAAVVSGNDLNRLGRVGP